MSSKMQLTSCSYAVDKNDLCFFFSRWFSYLCETMWEWNDEKLEGGGSQILVTCPLHWMRLNCGPGRHVEGYVVGQ